MSKKPIIKVARKGYDIRTSDSRFLTLDSSRNQFKVSKQGAGTVTFATRSGGATAQRLSVDIVHNLGYQPSFIAWFKGPDDIWRLNPVMNTGTTGPTKWCTGIARLDENTIRLYIYIYDPIDIPGYSSFDVYYKYLIFTDPNKDVWS